MSATVHFRQGLSVARDEFRAEHSAHRLRHETPDFCAFRLFTHGGWLVSPLGFGQRVHFAGLPICSILRPAYTVGAAQKT
jgi:hypothetical protein